MKNKVQKEQLNLLCNLIPLDGIHFLAKVTFINISNALKYHFKGKKKKKKWHYTMIQTLYFTILNVFAV